MSAEPLTGDPLAAVREVIADLATEFDGVAPPKEPKRKLTISTRDLGTADERIAGGRG